jgi:hypothetical protein
MDKINIDTEENDPKVKSIREKNKLDEDMLIKERKNKGKCANCLIY